MRSKDESKFKIISDEIKRFMIEKGRIPTQRELSLKVGLGRTAICRYLKAMKEKGLIEGTGREISTKDIKLIPVPIVDSLYNSDHIFDKATIGNYIFISRKIYGEGEFGLIRAIDDSMSKANINVNNFLIVRRQRNSTDGQIVFVKSNNKYYLRRLIYDQKEKRQKLVAESNTTFVELSQYEICGEVISVIAHFDEKIIQNYMQSLMNM